MISLDDVKKVEITVGKILSAEKVPETDKLMHLSVDFAEENPRSVVSGIAEYFENPDTLVGNTYAFITNLEPREIKGRQSQAMILAAKYDKEEGSGLSLLSVVAPAGTRIT